MKFLKKYFNRKIKMLGRAGIIYTNKKIKYFIDSEVLIAPPSDVVLYKSDVKYWKDDSQNKGPLSEAEKEKIIQEVKLELESMGMSVEVK